ncbi:Pr6Pr family membrane protein [Lysobacter korlensis]|uniref:Pr6Pr family membrane protein n=1 Tax=Lysobacter korlensis TaxID=553636 RepID=A0ABV6RYW8_9GAMM
MIVAAARIAIAALAIGTVIADILLTGFAEGGMDLGNHFGQFTVLSNVFVAGVMLMNVARRARPPSYEPELRGSAVVAVVAAGLLHALLLGGLPAASGQVVNVLLHIVVPALAVLEWALVPSQRSPRWWATFAGLLFPSLFFVYTLIRGALVGWYPYDFVDPTVGGYGELFAGLGTVVVAFLVVSAVVMLVGMLRQAVARSVRTRTEVVA